MKCQFFSLDECIRMYMYIHVYVSWTKCQKPRINAPLPTPVFFFSSQLATYVARYEKKKKKGNKLHWGCEGRSLVPLSKSPSKQNVN